MRSLLVAAWVAVSSGCTGGAGEDNSRSASEESSESGADFDGPIPLDVEAIASATITGEADYSVNLGLANVADLDGDGQVDLILNYYADDNPEDDQTCSPGPSLRRLGWAQGPFVGDKKPLTLVDGDLDPMRSPLGRPELYDFDGDGHVELILPFENSEEPAPFLSFDTEDCADVSVPPVTYETAWFNRDVTPTTWAGRSFTTPASSVQDLDQDGDPDLLVRAPFSGTGAVEWWWFDKPVDAILPENATAVLSSTEIGQLWSRTATDGAVQTFLTGRVPEADGRRSAEWLVSGLNLAQGGPFELTAIKPSLDAGDIDGDGNGDVIRLGFGASETIDLDGWSSLAADSPPGLVVFGESFGEGPIVRPAGDLNGDGNGDVLVLRPLNRDELPDGESRGYRTWVFLGPLAAGTYEIGDAQAWSDGPSVLGLGDLDGDGLDDLAFIQPGWPEHLFGVDRQPGRVWIVTGADLVAAL